MFEPPNIDDIPLIYAPDSSLQKRIGVALKQIFTDERIRLAQQVVQKSSQLLLERCFEDSKLLREELDRLRSECDTSSEAFDNLGYITLRIKSSAGMVDYLIATQVANELYKFLQRLNGPIDPAAIAIIHTHVQTIGAAFRERLTGTGTPVTAEVVEELRRMSTGYRP